MIITYELTKTDIVKRVYYFDDGSFGDLNNKSYFQISINDASSCLLNVDRTNGKISSVEGYFPIEARNSILKFDFNPINIYEGKLVVVDILNEFEDEGCFMTLDNQNIGYDEKKDILAFGKTSNCTCIRCGENLYAFFEDFTFSGLAIKLIRS